MTQPKHKYTGFSLIELLIVIAIAGILIAVAIPSFQSTIERNRISNEAERIFIALKQTRSLAIQSGRLAITCRSTEAINNGGNLICKNGNTNGVDLRNNAALKWHNVDLITYLAPANQILPTITGRGGNFFINRLYTNAADRQAATRSIRLAENLDLSTTASDNDFVSWFNPDGTYGNGNSSTTPFRIGVCNSAGDATTGKLIEVTLAGLIRISDTDPNDTNRDCTPRRFN